MIGRRRKGPLRLSIVEKIKAREARSKASNVYLYGQRLHSPKINKAIQRYDLPTLCPSPSPSQSDLENIQISTPTPPNCANLPSPIRIISEDADECVGVGQNLAKPFSVIVNDHQPFLKLRYRLRKFCDLPLQPTVQLFSARWLREIVPCVAYQISPSWAKSCQSRDVFGSGDTHVLWATFLEQLVHFEVPTRIPDASSVVDTCLWVVEFIVIGSANGLLRPYINESISWLMESDSNILDGFLRSVRDNNFYTLVDRILDLRTVATYLCSAQMLLSSIMIEDEDLFNKLLAKRVPLDGTRQIPFGWNISALHMVVMKRNEKFVHRLLEAGIDPDGYVEGRSIHAVLESRRRVYQTSDCIEYLETLILRAWQADATQCLAFLKKYYQKFNAAQTSENLLAVVYQEDQEDNNVLLATLLTKAIRSGALTKCDYFWHVCLNRIISTRCDSLVTTVIRHWQWVDPKFRSFFIRSFYDDGNYVLNLPIELPGSLYLLLKLAVELEDTILSHVLFDQHLFLFFEDITQDLDSNSTIDPLEIESRAASKTAVSSTPRKPYMMAAQLISEMEFYGVTSWRSILYRVFERGISDPDVGIAAMELVIDMWRLACPHKRLKGTFERILRDIILPEPPVNIEAFKCVLKVFIQQKWCMDWSKIYGSSEDFYGRPDVVDELLKAGAQVDAYGYTNVFGSQTCTATALQIASGVGNYDMVCKLLQAGADINARGGMKLGCTALSAASINGRLDVIHLLITNNPHRQKLKLDEDETLEEIEDLLEREEEQEEEEEEGKGEEEEDVDTIDNWRLDSNEEKSNHGDEDSDHEMEADKVFEGWEDFMDVDMLGQ
ncbi:MAG: hypothetical protein Q9157_007784 [Trypethelium eluteriae]